MDPGFLLFLGSAEDLGMPPERKFNRSVHWCGTQCDWLSHLVFTFPRDNSVSPVFFIVSESCFVESDHVCLLSAEGQENFPQY